MASKSSLESPPASDTTTATQVFYKYSLRRNTLQNLLFLMEHGSATFLPNIKPGPMSVDTRSDLSYTVSWSLFFVTHGHLLDRIRSIVKTKAVSDGDISEDIYIVLRKRVTKPVVWSLLIPSFPHQPIPVLNSPQQKIGAEPEGERHDSRPPWRNKPRDELLEKCDNYSDKPMTERPGS